MGPKVDHRNISQLLHACSAGNRTAQRELYDLLFEPLLVTITGFRINQAEAEDLLQESYIRIYNHLASYDASKASITTWAKVITKRLAINYCETKKHRNLQHSLAELHTDLQAQQEIESRIDMESLEATLTKMPKKYSEVVRLSIFQGMRHAAIAERLQITESSSRAYLTRAIQLLQRDKKNIVL